MYLFKIRYAERMKFHIVTGLIIRTRGRDYPDRTLKGDEKQHICGHNKRLNAQHLRLPLFMGVCCLALARVKAYLLGRTSYVCRQRRRRSRSAQGCQVATFCLTWSQQMWRQLHVSEKDSRSSSVNPGSARARSLARTHERLPLIREYMSPSFYCSDF